MAGAPAGPATIGHDTRSARCVDGEQCGLRPAGEAQLGQDVRDVGAGGPLGHPELLRDRPVGQAAREAGQDVAFAGRQVVQAGRPAPPAGPAAAPSRIRRATIPATAGSR